MNLLNRYKFPAIAGILLVVGFVSSCEQEETTIGDTIIEGEPFTFRKQAFDVFAFNKKIEAVQTNQLPIYQLGVFNDPIYGKTTASITSQVQFTAVNQRNPTFGDLSATEEIEDAFNENERIDSIYIHIPYINNQTDLDQDGVVDALDGDPTSPDNDDDGDGLSNREESAQGTNPLVVDTDGDGINDNVDEENDVAQFAERFRLDSIYGNRMLPFNFKVERSTFFLRDFDPNSNFQESQEYFSTQEFSPEFTEEVFFDDQVQINDEEILVEVTQIDPDAGEMEETTVTTKLDPGIYVRLNEAAEDFFEQTILKNEGRSELLSPANFNNTFRGIHMSVTPNSDAEQLLMLLNIANAKMDVYYSYDTNTDDGIVREQETFELRLITQLNFNTTGNAVNTFVNEAYPPEITDAIAAGDTEVNPENAEKIYLKGGAGAFAEIKLFDANDATSILNEIRAQDWIINEANLVFYVDQDEVPISTIEPPRLYLYNAETNAPLYNALTENNVSDTPLGVFLNYDGILEESNDRGLKYTVKITEYINDIIVRDSTNATLGLMISPDIRLTGANNTMLSNGVEKDFPASGVLSPLGTVLVGSNVPDTNDKKLQLEIFFTEAN